MRMRFYAVAIAAVGIIAACSSDTIVDSKTLGNIGGPRFNFSGAVNSDFYNSGTCSNINGNIYPNQFTVGLDGSPSTIDAGSYYVRVTEPDGDVLGTSDGPTFVVGGGTTCYQVWDLVMRESDNTLQGFDETTNNGGEYRLLVSTGGSFLADSTKSDNFKIANFEEPTCEELNNCPSTASVFTIVKFYDADLSGTQNGTEPAITGWNIDLTLGAAQGIVETTYAINIADGTAYTASELKPSTGTWIPTTSITLSGNVPTGGGTIYFGNVCLAGGGGHTLGFWSNKNGQATMNDGGSIATELALLNGLPLANATGDQPDFATYSAFRTWILNATATNMAYMLSAQLAAMELNVEAGFVDGTALVYAPDVDGANVLGFISINDLMAAAVTALADQSTLADDPNRDEQEDIKNALDAANNNQNFLSATPCDLTGATWSAWPLF
jgi:hypothetical protein